MRVDKLQHQHAQREKIGGVFLEGRQRVKVGVQFLRGRKPYHLSPFAIVALLLQHDWIFQLDLIVYKDTTQMHCSVLLTHLSDIP